MKKILLCALLWSLSFAAHAVYKCESNGTTTYSDTACPNGKSTELAEPPKPSSSDTTSAKRQQAKDEKTAKQLAQARHKREATQDKLLNQAERRAAARQKKCAQLAQRKKWADEDANKSGSLKARERAKTRARRAGERLDLECRQ